MCRAISSTRRSKGVGARISLSDVAGVMDNCPLVANPGKPILNRSVLATSGDAQTGAPGKRMMKNRGFILNRT
jgi:hypothetical protein